MYLAAVELLDLVAATVGFIRILHDSLVTQVSSQLFVAVWKIEINKIWVGDCIGAYLIL